MERQAISEKQQGRAGRLSFDEEPDAQDSGTAVGDDRGWDINDRDFGLVGQDAQLACQ